MAKQYAALTPRLTEFIRKQHVYFVATSPLSATGSVNVSPKGMDTFRILDSKKVAYLDLTGSGNETVVHLQENGRITFMFCSFDEKPLVLRLYGHGRQVTPNSHDWDDLYALFPKIVGYRQIVVADLAFVRTSCGFGVPHMTFDRDRDLLERWAKKKGEEELTEYRRENNLCSIDGIPNNNPVIDARTVHHADRVHGHGVGDEGDRA